MLYHETRIVQTGGRPFPTQFVVSLAPKKSLLTPLLVEAYVFFRGLHSGSVWIPNSLLYGRESSKPIDLRIPGLRLLKPTVCFLVY